MRIQIVTDDVPSRGLWVCCYQRLQMRQEITFRAGRTTKRSQYLSRHDVAAENKGARSMTNVLKFSPFHFSWSERQPSVFPFQCLYSCQLISTDSVFSLLNSTRSFLIHATDLFHRFCSIFVDRRSQPVANHVRIEIPFLSIRAA